MYLASWSGGKDSCLATARAIEQGYDVRCLMNFISDDYRRVRFHGTTAGLIAEQAVLTGLELFQSETSADDHERDFKAAVASRVKEGFTGMVFGDICLEEHLQWVKRVCDEVGIKPLEPLWGESTEDLVSEFIERGFRSVVVGGQKDVIEKRWIGRVLDKDFVEYLKAKGADPCGEKGEFHTFVVGGPLFKGSIEIKDSEVIEKEGFWFLDIKEYEVIGLPLAAEK